MAPRAQSECNFVTKVLIDIVCIGIAYERVSSTKVQWTDSLEWRTRLSSHELSIQQEMRDVICVSRKENSNRHRALLKDLVGNPVVLIHDAH